MPKLLVFSSFPCCLFFSVCSTWKQRSHFCVSLRNKGVWGGGGGGGGGLAGSCIVCWCKNSVFVCAQK